MQAYALSSASDQDRGRSRRHDRLGLKKQRGGGVMTKLYQRLLRNGHAWAKASLGNLFDVGEARCMYLKAV